MSTSAKQTDFSKPNLLPNLGQKGEANANIMRGVEVIIPMLTAEICKLSIICAINGAKLVKGARKLIESSNMLMTNKVVVFDFDIDFRLLALMLMARLHILLLWLPKARMMSLYPNNLALNPASRDLLGL